MTNFKKGVSSLALALLVLGTSLLAVTVYVAGTSTGFFNFARQEHKQYRGTIRALPSCIDNIYCFSLVGTGGKSRYLLVKRNISNLSGRALSKYENKKAVVTGYESNLGNGKTVLWVVSIRPAGDGNTQSKNTSLFVTEFGSVEKKDSRSDQCLPRPACLDTNPPCEIYIAPGTAFCPSINVKSSEFILKTLDGRKYELVNKTGGTPCPPGMACAQVYKDPVDLNEFVGLNVLVEGFLRSNSQKPITWPLPDRLNFEVNAITPATNLKQDYKTAGILSKAQGKYAMENVYLFNPNTAGTAFVRSSVYDLSKYIDGYLRFSGDHFSVGKATFMNVNEILGLAPDLPRGYSEGGMGSGTKLGCNNNSDCASGAPYGATSRCINKVCNISFPTGQEPIGL